MQALWFTWIQMPCTYLEVPASGGFLVLVGGQKIRCQMPVFTAN